VLKVSVVIPTYRPKEGLDRLVASIDAQTLSTDEFEVIFVDDGSPDNTYARLQEVARTRPHVRVERIENSGWPSRPRNIGTDLARGEYVAFMDHDDELYPDALRRGYEFAAANSADVLSGKEARTHDAAWAIDLYREDLGQALGLTRQHPMIPMNPHKLYRRAFLIEHDIRFPEGGRVMWEDIFFNVKVMRHAQVMSVLASVPYYHWFTTRGSGSTGFQRSNPEFWQWLRRVLETTETDLAGPALAQQHRQLMGHQYRSRIIASFDTRFSGRGQAERDLIYDSCRRLQQDFDLRRFDDALNASGRMRAHLLAGDRRVLLEQLPQADPTIPGWGTATSLRWDGDTLRVEADVEWSSPHGRRHDFEHSPAGRVLKRLPEVLAEAIPADLRDVTEEIASATVELGMRSRESRVVWMLSSRAHVQAPDADSGRVGLTATLSGELDVTSAIFGSAVGADTWDLNVRTNLGGTITQTQLRAPHTATVSLHDGHVRLAYVNKDGFVTAHADDSAEAVRRLRPQTARVEGGALIVTLEGVHTGSGEIPVSVATVGGDGKPKGALPGVLAMEGQSVVLRFAAAPAQVRLRIGDRTPDGAAWWDVRTGSDGASLQRGRPVSQKPATSTVQRVRRAGGRVLRRLGLRR
jgi:hypothetical protein